MPLKQRHAFDSSDTPKYHTYYVCHIYRDLDLKCDGVRSIYTNKTPKIISRNSYRFTRVSNSMSYTAGRT